MSTVAMCLPRMSTLERHLDFEALLEQSRFKKKINLQVSVVERAAARPVGETRHEDEDVDTQPAPSKKRKTTANVPSSVANASQSSDATATVAPSAEDPSSSSPHQNDEQTCNEPSASTDVHPETTSSIKRKHVQISPEVESKRKSKTAKRKLGSFQSNTEPPPPEDEEVQIPNTKKRRKEGKTSSPGTKKPSESSTKDPNAEKSSHPVPSNTVDPSSAASVPPIQVNSSPKPAPSTSAGKPDKQQPASQAAQPSVAENPVVTAQQETSNPASGMKKPRKSKKAQSKDAAAVAPPDPPEPETTASLDPPPINSQSAPSNAPQTRSVNVSEEQASSKKTDAAEEPKRAKSRNCPKCKQPMKGHGKTCSSHADDDTAISFEPVAPAEEPSAAKKIAETERGRKPRTSRVADLSSSAAKDSSSKHPQNPSSTTPASRSGEVATSQDDTAIAPTKKKAQKRASSMGPPKTTSRLVVEIPSLKQPLKKTSTASQPTSKINDKLASTSSQSPANQKSMEEMVREILQKRMQETSSSEAGSGKVNGAKASKGATAEGAPQPASKKQGPRARRASEHSDSCPVCLEKPFHLRYKCPIIVSGHEAVKKRIRELEQANAKGEDNADLIDELKKIISKAGMTGESRQKGIDSTSKAKMKEVSDVSKENAVQETAKSKKAQSTATATKSSKAASRKGDDDRIKVNEVHDKLSKPSGSRKSPVEPDEPPTPAPSQPVPPLSSSILASLRPRTSLANQLTSEGRETTSHTSGVQRDNPQRQRSEDEEDDESSSSETSSGDESSTSDEDVPSQDVDEIPEALLKNIDDPSVLLRPPGIRNSAFMLEPAFWSGLMREEENSRARTSRNSDVSREDDVGNDEANDSEADDRLLKRLQRKGRAAAGSTRVIGRSTSSDDDEGSATPRPHDINGQEGELGDSHRLSKVPLILTAENPPSTTQIPPVRTLDATVDQFLNTLTESNAPGKDHGDLPVLDQEGTTDQTSPSGGPNSKKLVDVNNRGESVDASLQDDTAALDAETEVERSLREDLAGKKGNGDEQKESREVNGATSQTNGKSGDRSSKQTDENNSIQDNGKPTRDPVEEISDVESSETSSDSDSVESSGNPLDDVSQPKYHRENTPSEPQVKGDSVVGSPRRSTRVAARNTPLNRAKDTPSTSSETIPEPRTAQSRSQDKTSEMPGRGKAKVFLPGVSRNSSRSDENEQLRLMPHQDELRSNHLSVNVQSSKTAPASQSNLSLPAWNVLTPPPPTSSPDTQTDQLRSEDITQDGLNGSQAAKILVEASQENREEEDVDASLQPDSSPDAVTGDGALRNSKLLLSQTPNDPRSSLRSAYLPSRKSPGLFLSSSQPPSVSYPSLRSLTQRGLGDRMSISSVATPTPRKQANAYPDDDDDDDDDDTSSSDEDKSVPAHRKAGSTLK
ncbi:hypothetical protein FRC02_009121 [Tulasnella sp. 418]|nr:hypothetical protein FRC02_009121 [Tulasnella sp. 418]